MLFCGINLESCRPNILWSITLLSLMLCCTLPIMLSLNLIFHVVLHYGFAVLCCAMPFSPTELRTVALLQCFASHTSVIITRKLFNEQFGAKLQPFESPENCLTQSLTRLESFWNVYSGNIPLRRLYNHICSGKVGALSNCPTDFIFSDIINILLDFFVLHLCF